MTDDIFMCRCSYRYNRKMFFIVKQTIISQQYKHNTNKAMQCLQSIKNNFCNTCQGRSLKSLTFLSPLLNLVTGIKFDHDSVPRHYHNNNLEDVLWRQEN